MMIMQVNPLKMELVFAKVDSTDDKVWTNFHTVYGYVQAIYIYLQLFTSQFQPQD